MTRGSGPFFAVSFLHKCIFPIAHVCSILLTFAQIGGTRPLTSGNQDSPADSLNCFHWKTKATEGLNFPPSLSVISYRSFHWERSSSSSSSSLPLWDHPHFHWSLISSHKSERVLFIYFIFVCGFSWENLKFTVESEQMSTHRKPNWWLFRFSNKQWVFPGKAAGQNKQNTQTYHLKSWEKWKCGRSLYSARLSYSHSELGFFLSFKNIVAWKS